MVQDAPDSRGATAGHAGADPPFARSVRAKSVAGPSALGYSLDNLCARQRRAGTGARRTMIKTEHVSKVYRGDVKALVDVNIDIAKGEFVFLVGASGSGKSTFTKILTKDEEPTEGEAYVAGRPLNRLPKWRVPYLRRALGGEPLTTARIVGEQVPKVLLADLRVMSLQRSPGSAGGNRLAQRRHLASRRWRILALSRVRSRRC